MVRRSAAAGKSLRSSPAQQRTVGCSSSSKPLCRSRYVPPLCLPVCESRQRSGTHVSGLQAPERSAAGDVRNRAEVCCFHYSSASSELSRPLKGWGRLSPSRLGPSPRGKRGFSVNLALPRFVFVAGLWRSPAQLIKLSGRVASLKSS